MKLFRLFYKLKGAKTTEKCIEIDEDRFLDFEDAFSWAKKHAEEKGYRVVMVAELPE